MTETVSLLRCLQCGRLVHLAVSRRTRQCLVCRQAIDEDDAMKIVARGGSTGDPPDSRTASKPGGV